jgi:hypothetical protein
MAEFDDKVLKFSYGSLDTNYGISSIIDNREGRRICVPLN